MKRWSLVLPALCAGLLLTEMPEVHAGGFYVPPHGVRGMGRGGAMVASEPDLHALWYNPALLAGIGGTHILVDVGFSSHNAEFARAPRLLPNGELRFFESVTNEGAILPAPQLAISSDFGLDRVVFALGAFAPNATSGNYPEKGPQRYALIDNEGGTLLTLEVAVAAQIADWLWIGGGFQNTFVSLRLINMVSGFPGPTGDAEDPEFDILLKTELSSAFNPSANMGIWGELLEGLQFGLSLQLPTHIEDSEARVTTRLPTHPFFDNAVVVGDTVSGSFDFPLILRGGLRYAQPLWDVELDVFYEMWSILDQIKTTPKGIQIENVEPGLGTVEVGSLNIPRLFEDSLSVRLGGDHQVVPGRVWLRAGAMWEQTAIPSKSLSVAQIDMDKMVLGLGGTYKVSEVLKLDVGYSHVFYFGGDVTDSVVEQLNPTNPEGAIVVGNGRYEASGDLFGIGARFNF